MPAAGNREQDAVTPGQVRQVEFVCAEVGKILTGLLQAPAAKGQQVVIHVSRDRREVWIEKPAEMVHIRLDGVHEAR